MKKHILYISTLFFSVIVCAQDGTLKIEGTGSIKVFTTASLTVKDKITNLGDGTNFIVQSDANLIQINNINTNVGNIKSERDFKISEERKQYNYLGSPVAFASGESYKTIFPGSTNTQVLYHNQTTNTFVTSSGANIPGRGSAVKEPPTTTVLVDKKTTAKFLGVPQSGNISIGIANRDTNISTYGYNLVGNPYASNIDLIKLYALNGGDPQRNISATFYLWDNNVNDIYVQQGSGYMGQAYAIYNVLTGNSGTGTAAAGTSGGISGTKKPTNIIKVGQGFMTRSLKTTYDFRFDNTIRTNENAGVDFLGKSGSMVEDDRYWLKMTAPSGITSTIAIVHYPGGNDLFGPEDSRSLGGSDALYTIVEDEKLAIDGRSNMKITDIIPLGCQHFVGDEYIIGIDTAEGIFANGQNIYLKDKQTGIVTNLSEQNYRFSANAGESAGRFVIIYQPETILSTTALNKDEFIVYKNGSNFILKSESKKIDEVEVFDVVGKLLKVLQPNSKQATLDVTTLINGVYILKVTIGGKIMTKKVIK
ncbi:T9SS type A sorting domain-containing protein [Kaistella sp. G5-32]|uniref:T9SS type A sorting domain-containing protein n=1 Tax=Kaistella gelatinilytica TaxID=2787636 RepID=A0ABS0FBX9_9FLAO|nr:T9SS type A sorting domain-containing protein [Kaistella gelatinilytica]MBF8457227.1 T9SS type A sorting domain-containing protein [Kaistella gelatinilytica]